MEVQFLKKHGLLLGLGIAILLYVIAIQRYPGGSAASPDSKGYHWNQNYFCNLMSKEAVNGKVNPSYVIAISAMAVACISIAFFYYGFAKKVNDKPSSRIIKYCGVGSMISTSLVFTSHDLFNTSAAILSMVTIFTIVVFLFQKKAHFFKWFGVVCLAVLYFSTFVYYTQQFLFLLAILQKVIFLITAGWFLCLHYYYKSDAG